MSTLFLKVLNVSITAGWLILAVTAVRFLLKKAPRWISCVLWALVALRLLCPISLESSLSIIPSTETVPADIEMMQKPAINSGISIINQAVNPILEDAFAPAPMASANPLQIVLPILSALWLAGIAAMLIYALVSFLKLKKTVGASIPVAENILACDEIKSPFILGIFRPVIYIPSAMSGETLDHVIAHERAHIARRDNWWKPLGFLLLTVYWFNPLCWLSYVLLCRDIEAACDERVIRDLDRDAKAAYSQALLDCSFPRKKIAACPLAFGEVGVKERVKSVLNYKKPAFWVIVIALALCMVLAICFGTNPRGTSLTSWKTDTVDMKLALDNMYSLTVRYESREALCSGSNANRFLATMDKIKVGRVVSKSRDEDRSKVFTVTVNGALTLNFNESFTEIWVDNGVKPSYTYRITNPETAAELLADLRFTAGPMEKNQFYGVVEITYANPRISSVYTLGEDSPEYMLDAERQLIRYSVFYDSSPYMVLGKVSEIELTKANFDDLFVSQGTSGWALHESAAEIRKNNAAAWSVIFNPECFYYILLQKNGEIFISEGYYDFEEKNDPASDDSYIFHLFRVAPEVGSGQEGQ